MNRLDFSPVRILFWFFALTLISVAQPRQVQASVYNFFATTLDGSQWSSFSLQFDDGSRGFPADGLFQLPEMIAGSFGGVTINSALVLKDLASVPDTSCSTFTPGSVYIPPDPTHWLFYSPLPSGRLLSYPATNWSYSVSPAETALLSDGNWNTGDWSNGVPDQTTYAVIDDYAATLDSPPAGKAKSLWLGESNGLQSRLSIENGATLDITNDMRLGKDSPGSWGQVSVQDSGSALNVGGNLIVGEYGVGDFGISEGDLKAGKLTLGLNEGSWGTLSLPSGSTATIGTNSMTVGAYGGRGDVYQYGGQVTAGSLVLGDRDDTQASYYLKETGSLTVTGNMTVGGGAYRTATVFEQGRTGSDVIGQSVVTVNGSFTVGGGDTNRNPEIHRYAIWQGTLDVRDLNVMRGTFAIEDAAAIINVHGDFILGGIGRIVTVPGSTLNMLGSNFRVYPDDPYCLGGLQNLKLVFLGGDEVTDNLEVGFNLGALEIGPNSHVQLVDLVDNAQGAQDALYVDNLTLGAGSTLNLNNRSLYVKQGAGYEPVNSGDFGGQVFNLYAVTNDDRSTRDESHPQVVDDGRIIWQGYDGQDYEIYCQAPGGPITKLTDNTSPDIRPQMNASGQTVWMNWDGEDYEVWCNLGNGPVQLTNNIGAFDVLPQITAAGQIYWQGWDGYDYEIYRYNPATQAISQLTDNSLPDAAPQVNASGQLAWMLWDNPDWEIYYNAGSGPVQLTTNTYHDTVPQITPEGEIYWQSGEDSNAEICRYSIGSGITENLTNNTVADCYPAVKNGVLVWAQWDGSDYEIYRLIFNTSFTTRITDDDKDDVQPGLNASGQIAWMKLDYRSAYRYDYNVYTYK